MKKILIICIFCFAAWMTLYADENADLQWVMNHIKKFNVNCSCNGLLATSKDQVVYSVNFYIKDGAFKKKLKSLYREEYIRRAGNKRKWQVTKNQGVGESLYLFHEFQEVDRSWKHSPEFKVKNIQDVHHFAFKNYCEVDGKVSDDFARIKKLKITFFEAQYKVVNNLMNYQVANQFKKTKSFEVSFPNEPEIVYPMPAYKPVGSTEDVPGTIFVIKLSVLDVYPGKEGQSLCAEDFYLGYKEHGEYAEVLKQIDKL